MIVTWDLLYFKRYSMPGRGRHVEYRERERERENAVHAFRQPWLTRASIVRRDLTSQTYTVLERRVQSHGMQRAIYIYIYIYIYVCDCDMRIFFARTRRFVFICLFKKKLQWTKHKMSIATIIEAFRKKKKNVHMSHTLVMFTKKVCVCVMSL